MVQAGGGGVMVWGIFSCHTLSPLVSIEHCLNATAYLSIVADHVHPFMTTVNSSSEGYFQQMWWNGRFALWMCSRQICSNMDQDH